MAPAATEAPAWPRFALPAGLRPTPGRLAFTVRLSAICALTALIVEIYQTPEAALTIYVAFFLNKPDRVSSLILGAVLVVLTTILLGIIFVLANFVLDRPFRLVVAIAIVSVVVLFIASASKLAALGGTIALILAFALDFLGDLPSGELATRTQFIERETSGRLRGRARPSSPSTP